MSKISPIFATTAMIFIAAHLLACDDPAKLQPPDELEPEPVGCRPGEGATGSPKTIDQAVKLINSLPRPVTLTCFVQALDKPLALMATDSEFSAQPAQGRDNPRIFIFIEPLILSITLGERGIHLLEFGQLLDDGSSIKGELAFPIEDEPLAASAPYAHIMYNERITNCSLCHTQERPINTIDDVPVFASRALRPVSYQRVPLDDLRAQRDLCIQEDPLSPRCALIEALHWSQTHPPQEHDFPEDLDTFF